MFPHLVSKFRKSVILHEPPGYTAKPRVLWYLWVLGRCAVVEPLCFLVTAGMPLLMLLFITCVALDKYLNLSVCLSIFISKMGVIRAPASEGCQQV